MTAKVKVETSSGVFVLEVLSDRMPRSCDRFLAFVERGFYDGTHFHRVVPGALVQGGDPLSRDMTNANVGTGGSLEGPFPDEHVARISNEVGTVGFSSANRKDSCDCQFFVNLAHNDHLDWWKGGGHAPFARVVDGLAVVRAIGATPNTGRMVGERPTKPVQIISVTLL